MISRAQKASWPCVCDCVHWPPSPSRRWRRTIWGTRRAGGLRSHDTDSAAPFGLCDTICRIGYTPIESMNNYTRLQTPNEKLKEFGVEIAGLRELLAK